METDNQKINNFKNPILEVEHEKIAKKIIDLKNQISKLNYTLQTYEFQRFKMLARLKWAYKDEIIEMEKNGN